MKEFVIYTLLRVVLFAVTWGVVLGAWVLTTGSASLGLTVLIAFVLSGIGSYYALRGPRENFARVVEARASRATARFDEMKAREDSD